MDSGTAQPNGAADVYAALFADATITTDDFLSHDVTTEERPGGAGVFLIVCATWDILVYARTIRIS